MSEHSSNNEEGEELENELPSGVSISQGVLTTPFGSWPISKISEVTIHVRPFWLTMIIAGAAGAVMTQLFVLAYHVDPKSFRASLIYILTMACVVGAGKIVVKVRSEGIQTTVWKETYLFFGYLHAEKGSADILHNLIKEALQKKSS
jgi:hypothetical protein